MYNAVYNSTFRLIIWGIIYIYVRVCLYVCMYVRLYLYEYIIIQLQLTQIYNVNTLCLSFCKARAITSVLGRFLHVTALLSFRHVIFECHRLAVFLF